LKSFLRIDKIKEKIIYFLSLCVKYNNRSPIVGNDSQNGINSLTPKSILAGTKTPARKDFGQLKSSTQTSPP
jgi:hypothetical protein